MCPREMVRHGPRVPPFLRCIFCPFQKYFAEPVLGQTDGVGAKLFSVVVSLLFRRVDVPIVHNFSFEMQLT